MSWESLKTMCCPRCGSHLEGTSIGYVCTQTEGTVCKFAIGHERFQEIVREMYKPPAPVVYEADLVDRSGWE